MERVHAESEVCLALCHSRSFGVSNYCIQRWKWHALAWNAGPHVMCPWPCSVQPYFFTLLVPSMLCQEVPLLHAPFLCRGKAKSYPNQVPSYPT